MLIDWFTVGAQVLNFIILIGLMKHFLYGPILKGIDTREKLIAAELADAAQKKANAQKESDDYRHKLEDLERQRGAVMAKAADEAKAERERLIGEAVKAADGLAAARRESLKNEARTLDQSIRRRIQDEVFAVARRVLSDLATTGLEERIGEVFTRRLREMDPAQKEKLAAALKSVPGPALLRSAFELSQDQRGVVQNALNEAFSSQVRLRFETAPDLVAGIELISNGQKVAWNIADYLGSLQKGVAEHLETPGSPAPATVASLS